MVENAEGRQELTTAVQWRHQWVEEIKKKRDEFKMEQKEKGQTERKVESRFQELISDLEKKIQDMKKEIELETTDVQNSRDEFRDKRQLWRDQIRKKLGESIEDRLDRLKAIKASDEFPGITNVDPFNSFLQNVLDQDDLDYDHFDFGTMESAWEKSREFLNENQKISSKEHATKVQKDLELNDGERIKLWKVYEKVAKRYLNQKEFFQHLFRSLDLTKKNTNDKKTLEKIEKQRLFFEEHQDISDYFGFFKKKDNDLFTC